MRVLHVVPALAERYGGPSAAAVGFCAALRIQGVETLLAATDADGAGRLPVPTGVETSWKGVPALFFGRWPGESLKFSPGLARWLAQNVRKFDLVHSHAVFSYAPVAAGAACARAAVPHIVRPLGHLDPWSLSQGRLRKRLFLIGPGRRLLRRASAIHWTAAAEREVAGAVAEGLPGFVLPVGVDDSLFCREPGGADSRSVLALSRLHPKKNLEALIEAFLDVSPPSWSLVIAGDGEAAYAESLRRLAGRLGGAKRVTFPGWLAGEEKAAALRGAALLALPSRQENFGIAAAEALACGIPVLVSDTVNLSADVRRAGAGWVVRLDPDGIRGGLRAALASADERETRGRAGRHLADEKYRWDVVGRALVHEYEAILGRGEGGA